MKPCCRLFALLILGAAIAAAGCRSTDDGVHDKADRQAKVSAGKASGLGSFNIAGGALRMAGLGESMKVNFVSLGHGVLYVKTANTNAKAIGAILAKGLILVDGEVQKDSSRLSVIELSDGPNAGFTEVRVR